MRIDYNLEHLSEVQLETASPVEIATPDFWANFGQNFGRNFVLIEASSELQLVQDVFTYQLKR